MSAGRPLRPIPVHRMCHAPHCLQEFGERWVPGVPRPLAVWRRSWEDVVHMSAFEADTGP